MSLSLIGLISALLTLLGIGAWFFLQEKKKLTSFPILSVLDLNPQTSPRLKPVLPPWILFICFLVCSLAVASLLFKPQLPVSGQKQVQEFRILLVADLSPSMSAANGVGELIEKVRKTHDAITNAGFQVSIVRSSDGRAWEAGESLEDYLSSSSFHTEPLAMAKLVGAVSERFPDLYGMVFVSDGEQSTWGGFNWQALENDFTVRLAVADRPRNTENFFIGGVRSTNSYKREQVWQMNLGRNYSGEDLTVKIKAEVKDKEIWRGEVRFYEGQSAILEELTLPRQNTNSLIRFTISAEKDAVELDNSVLVRSNDRLLETIIIAKSTNERVLHDPWFHLEAGLVASGAAVSRVESGFSSRLQEPTGLVIATQSEFWDASEQCPLNTNADRIWIMASSGRYDQNGVLAAPKEAQMMCACFDSLSKNLKEFQAPGFCNDISTIGELATTFRSLGGKQIGGLIDREEMALAWGA